MSRKSIAYQLFEAGKSVADVARTLEISRQNASTLHVMYLKDIGSDKVAHVGKGAMIHKLLAGRTNLKIYETCGFAKNGAPGVCTQAYKKYGEVKSRKTEDGDWTITTHAELLSGNTYDVVDIDGFGVPFDPLLIGITKLLKPGGLLLTTWPGDNYFRRFPVMQYRARLTGGLPWDAEGVDRHGYIERVAAAHLGKAHLVMVSKFDHTYRYAHRITKVKWRTKVEAHENVKMATQLFTNPRRYATIPA